MTTQDNTTETTLAEHKLTLREKLCDCEALAFAIRKEHPEVESITMALNDIALEEIESLKLGSIDYSQYRRRAGAIVYSKDNVTVFAYTKPCRLAEPNIKPTPALVFDCFDF